MLGRYPVSLDACGLPNRIVAIADIHGMSRHFDRLIDGVSAIEGFGDAAFYILGDLVDRGPDSRGVMDRTCDLLNRREGSRLVIGNHDLWFRRFLSAEMDEADYAHWLDQGGSETLSSYDVASIRDRLAAREHVLRVSPGHLELIEAAHPIIIAGDFAFVHAGIDPRRSVFEQTDHDCAWIRAPFLKHEGRLSHVIVHGHRPQKGGRPVVTENRISIDTAAVFGRVLTAALIDRVAGTIAFVSADERSAFPNSAIPLDRGFGTVLDRFPPR
ncbi:metallophosphoesterase [Fulvimarina endophytica]|nr:metallophosphoesterase [Fulvimarina endophytica]